MQQVQLCCQVYPLYLIGNFSGYIMNGVMIFLIVFSILCTALIAPLSQFNRYDINPTYFKRVKVKRCCYLIRGLGGRNSKYGDVKNFGVIYPMFLIQILGYILSFSAVVLALVLVFASQASVIVVAIVSCSILIFQGVICAIIILSCVIVTKKKDID